MEPDHGGQEELRRQSPITGYVGAPQWSLAMEARKSQEGRGARRVEVGPAMEPGHGGQEERIGETRCKEGSGLPQWSLAMEARKRR